MSICFAGKDYRERGGGEGQGEDTQHQQLQQRILIFNLAIGGTNAKFADVVWPAIKPKSTGRTRDYADNLIPFF